MVFLFEMLMSEWKLNKMALRNKRALQTKQWRVTFNQSISSLQRVCKFNHHHSTSHTHTNRPQQTTVCSLNHPLSRYADIHITDFNLAAARSSQWATDTLPPERTPVRIRERTLVGSPGGTQRRTRGKTRRRNRRGGITKRTPRRMDFVLQLFQDHSFVPQIHPMWERMGEDARNAALKVRDRGSAVTAPERDEFVRMLYTATPENPENMNYGYNAEEDRLYSREASPVVNALGIMNNEAPSEQEAVRRHSTFEPSSSVYSSEAASAPRSRGRSLSPLIPPAAAGPPPIPAPERAAPVPREASTDGHDRRSSHHDSRSRSHAGPSSEGERRHRHHSHSNSHARESSRERARRRPRKPSSSSRRK